LHIDAPKVLYNLTVLHHKNISWCHIAHHMMVILLIYSYHMIDKMAAQNTNDLDVKGNTLIQHFVVLVVLFAVTKSWPFQVRKYLLLKDWINTSINASQDT